MGTRGDGKFSTEIQRLDRAGPISECICHRARPCSDQEMPVRTRLIEDTNNDLIQVKQE